MLLALPLLVALWDGPTSSFAKDYRSRVQEKATPAGRNVAEKRIELLPTGQEWVDHLENDLMPFWMSPDALGTPVGNFPTFRANNGSAIDPKNPPLEVDLIPDSETWIKNKLGRQYSRMMGRQIYAYCVAYHLTGKEKYLQQAKAGTEYLLATMKDPKGGFYTWRENDKLYPENPRHRISQDMTYALMGPAMYYYLTRDPQILKVLQETKDYIFKTYKVFPNSNQLAWVLEDYQDPGDPNELNTADQKELVAQLDQINAYMLLTTGLLEGRERKEWLTDMVNLATLIKKEYYRPQIKLFAGCVAGPNCNSGPAPLGEPHVDYGHTIKTYWMLYLIGSRFNQHQLTSFAKSGMPGIFRNAFDASLRTWIEKPPTPGKNGTNGTDGKDRIWWVHDELDQAAATLALTNPDAYVKYLVPTYMSWFIDMTDPLGKEVPHGLRDDNPMYLKAHLWKNAFHDTEHALIGYITSQALKSQPVQLYYAFVEKPKNSLIQPYLLQGNIKKIQKMNSTLAGVGKYRVTFNRIKP